MAPFLLVLIIPSDIPIFGGDLLATKNGGCVGCLELEFAFASLLFLRMSIGREGVALSLP